MSQRSPISLPAAMNYASTTADGKMLAAVGDSTEVYIFVNDSGRWRRYAEITVAEDPCFSAVFSPSQQCLAVGSQDVLFLSAIDEPLLNSGRVPVRYLTPAN